jgi:spoIIIJ-associated protein
MENDNDKVNTITYCLGVKKTIEDFLGKMDILFEEVEVFKGLSEHGPRFIIKSQESGLLIGHRGEHLRAFNHLVRKIVLKKSEVAKFTIDINNYQEENIKRLRNKALAIAEEVKNTGDSQEMEPMSAYERMVVHSMFGQDPEINTESVGERDQRHVIIKKRKLGEPEPLKGK